MGKSVADSGFQLQRVTPEMANYPPDLHRCPGFKAPPVLHGLGSLTWLCRPAVALFCSSNCPAGLVVQAQELVQLLQESHLLPIGGFHTPVEQDWLHLLLDQATPVIHCPARSLDNFRLSPPQIQALHDQRLLLLSPFPASARRATAQLAAKRNLLVASLATAVVVAYAPPEGKTAALAQQLIRQGKPVFTLQSPYNQMLLEMGARAVGEVGK